jgi:hypothetical protein
MTATMSGGNDRTDPVGSAGPADVSELVGWESDLPTAPQRAISDVLSVGMTADEIRALYREKTNNPYLTLSTAYALRAWDLKMGYLRQDFRTGLAGPTRDGGRRER